MKVCEIVVGVSELHNVRLYATLLCTGVPQISKVPLTTQDEDKSGKAMLYTVNRLLVSSLTDSH